MIYEYECANGHRREIHAHHQDKGCGTLICRCGHTMAPIISQVNAMLYFEEGRTRRFENLNTLDEKGNEIPCPELKTWKDYERQKKKAGVTEAGNRMGEKGVWI